MLTFDSLFVHCSEPLPTTKQMNIEHKKKAYEVAYLYYGAGAHTKRRFSLPVR